MRSTIPGPRALAIGAVAAIQLGCLGGGTEDSTPGNSGGEPPQPPPPAENRAPVISGTPDPSVMMDRSYEFRPTAADPDGDLLSFTIENMPEWATFDPATGRIHGTPDQADVGYFDDISISVTDGVASDTLQRFAIEVLQAANGSVTISWNAPSTDADGSPIDGLSGYRIYFGRSANALDEVVDIDQPSINAWVIDNLEPDTWYFSMTSYNDVGLESTRTAVTAVTVG